MKLTFDKTSNTLIIDMTGNKVYSDNSPMFQFDLDSQGHLKDAGIGIVIKSGHFVSNVSGNMMSFGNISREGKAK